jgi:hypothetical protein
MSSMSCVVGCNVLEKYGRCVKKSCETKRFDPQKSPPRQKTLP